MAVAITTGYTFSATELVTSTKLNAAVNSATILGITNTEIASDAAINVTKLTVTSAAAGDILYHNGTSFVRLPKGAGGSTLKMNAGATAPEWV